jgi:predicted nucleic acid-binding protein
MKMPFVRMSPAVLYNCTDTGRNFMDIVVDASIIIAVIANEQEKDAIVQATVGAGIVAPSSVFWEIGNAFSAMLKRNRITLEQCSEALRIYKSIPVRYVGIEMDHALRIAADLRIYAYDAYLLETALRYKLPLMTLDIQLSRYAEMKGINIIEVRS